MPHPGPAGPGGVAPVAPSSQPTAGAGKARAVNVGAVVTRAPGWAGDGATDEADGERVAAACVPDWIGGELIAAAEHAVTASRTLTATAIAGKRAGCHTLSALHRLEAPSL